MAKIKDAIERGVYPVQTQILVTEDQPQNYFINDEEIAKFHKEREFKTAMQVDRRDEWYDTWCMPAY
jgi:hypothetical protein